MSFKQLLPPTTQLVSYKPFVSDTELHLRQSTYDTISSKKFSSLRTKLAFLPAEFTLQGKTYKLNYNVCMNPLCKNYGLPQKSYNTTRKPSRYGLTGDKITTSFRCNEDKENPDGIPTLGCYTMPISHWSLIDEIDRLHRINALEPVNKEYEFHKIGCLISYTPFDSDEFYKKGKNSAGSQRYQCKWCKKITSVLPNKTQRTNFNQKRNDILPLFAKLLVNKVPINRTCDVLEIGKGTYYQKLEWLYRCCLEFLETRETKPLAKKEFNEMWLTTDKLQYNLNNVLKKGRGRNSGKEIEDKQLQTSIVATADKNSYYVFRTDLCYDWDISLEAIEEHTHLFKEDHLPTYVRKYDRFGKYGVAPVKPTKLDTQSMADFIKERNQFELRKHYVDGIHTRQLYTTMAHLFHIKNLVKAKQYRFVSDDDASIQKSYLNVFHEEIKSKMAHYFLCVTDKTLTRKQARLEFNKSLVELKKFCKDRGYPDDDLKMTAIWYIEEELRYHAFYNKHATALGELYITRTKNKLKHPQATSDRGKREIDVMTDLTHLADFEFARLLEGVNDNAINMFFQMARRRLFILERPLSTSRGDGLSYIYSNFNPKYAQMAITILRTYYNFCNPIFKNGIKKTPAQLLGIADKQYEWRDIIYKR